MFRSISAFLDSIPFFYRSRAHKNKRTGFFIYNDSTTLSFQLTVTLGIIVFISTISTLAVCLSISYELGDVSYTTADRSIRTQTQSNVLISAQEIALAIDSEIRLLGNSVSMKSVKYTSTLFENGTVYRQNKLRPVLKPSDTFHEYDFVDGCSYPSCPTDFGSLVGRAHTVKVHGSMDASSLYVYRSTSSVTGAVKSDTDWNNLVNQYKDLQLFVDLVQPQDLDMKTMYSYGPNSTEFYYLSLLYPISDSTMQPSPVPGAEYVSLHRTYPGINIDSTDYDPAHRAWFQDAPIDDFHVYGPYLQPFTLQLSLTVSSRAVFPFSGSSKTITAVSATVIQLVELSNIISRQVFPNQGFGALINYNTHEVVLYGNEPPDNFYLQSKGRFKYLEEVDPALSKRNLNVSSTFEYTDSSGVGWIVASVPFFKHTSYSTGKRNYALVMLVFSKKSAALGSLPALKKLISKTTTDITLVTVFICVFLAFSLLTLVVYVISWLTKPLDKIKHLSERIVEISAEEDIQRNYKKVLEEEELPTQRTDEIGALVTWFWAMVNRLYRDDEKRKKRPKYPKNPFFIRGGVLVSQQVEGHVKWEAFQERFYEEISKATAAEEANEITTLNSQDSFSGEVRPGTRTSTADTVSSGRSLLPREYLCHPFTSLKFYWYVLSVFLLGGLTLVTFITLYQLQIQGTKWMDNTGVSLQNQQNLNLLVIANAKAKAVSSYFVEIQMNIQANAKFVTALIDGKLTYPNASEQTYLKSYSMDELSDYPSTASTSKEYSGYFILNATNCKSLGTCSIYQNLPEVKLTSLIDLQLRSNFHNHSNFDFFNIGFKSALTRIIPYDHRPFGYLAHCYTDDTTLYSFCKSAYYNSRCGDLSKQYYAPFDPRCRGWYSLAIRGNDPNKVFFQYPRVGSSDKLDITASTVTKSGSKISGSLIGAMNLNVLAESLSTSINAIRILNSGYVYLIDTTNPPQAIIHSKLSSSVTPAGTSVQSLVINLEGFSQEEFAVFNRTVLYPIKLGTSEGVVSQYTKAGKPWVLAHSSFKVGTVSYTMVATVPLDEVLAVSTSVHEDIDRKITDILYIFIYLLACLVFVLIVLSFTVVSAMVRPLNEITNVCQRVARGSYDVDVPRAPSSLDAQILLHAFSNMLIAIKFSNDEFVRGEIDLAQKVFKEALNLYTLVGNRRGIGISQNNLGTVDLARGNYRVAENHFKEAISNARDLIESASSWLGAGKAQRVLSDRLGNLAVTYLDQNRLEEAATVLIDAMEEDKKQNYIRGYIVKQGTLGQLLLKKKAYEAASRVITDALHFAGNPNSSLMDEFWTPEEAAVTEQIALCNIALLYETQGRLSEAEEAYIDSLTYHQIMHTATTTKALISLRNIFVLQNRIDHLQVLDTIAAHFKFKISPISVSTVMKRIAFIPDLSGRNDSKFVSMVSSGFDRILNEYLAPSDLTTIIRASNKYGTQVTVPLLPLDHQRRVLEAKLKSCLKFKAEGSLLQAILRAIDDFNDGSLSTVDWVVAISDNNTINKKDENYKAVRSLLSQSVVGLVLIVTGDQSTKEPLRELTVLAGNSLFVHMNPDEVSITETFSHVLKFVQGDAYVKGRLILEEA